LDQEILIFRFDLPESFSISPSIKDMTMADLPEDGRLEWMLKGTMPGAKGSIRVFAGPYEASCEIVIAEHAAERGFGLPSKEKSAPWIMDNSVDLFAGYELRNLNNEMERAVYSPKERLILINTEAPTVRLYVNGQGHFKDGARLLLAELFLDVITEELSRFYVDRSMHKGEAEAYHQAKQDMIRRYGVEIHSILMGE
ncbi:MAG: ATP-binding protein, partial [Eubacteriaceae bacterium]|nr:ATP-binding protein [Eubacteriaceae bacterium]